jgi:hypothetical protein
VAGRRPGHLRHDLLSAPSSTTSCSPASPSSASAWSASPRSTAEEALALAVTGPLLRSTGVPWDLRRTMPYLAYDQVDFDVIVGTYGDNFDRYAIRLNEIRESIASCASAST